MGLLLVALTLLSTPLVLLAQEGKGESAKAQDLLKDALAQAKEGKKRVLLTFGGPG